MFKHQKVLSNGTCSFIFVGLLGNMVECEFVDDFNYGVYLLKYSKANWLNMDGILQQGCTMTADLVAHQYQTQLSRK